MMKMIFATAVASLALAATAALAQTAAPQPSAQPASPAAKVEVTPPIAAPASATITLSDDEAKAWVNKIVYSSDDKNLGEVAAIARDSSGKVSELHADIGGFLGLGETRVRVMPAEFKLMQDKVVLNITAESAKSLPRIAK